MRKRRRKMEVSPFLPNSEIHGHNSLSESISLSAFSTRIGMDGRRTIYACFQIGLPQLLQLGSKSDVKMIDFSSLSTKSSSSGRRDRENTEILPKCYQDIELWISFSRFCILILRNLRVFILKEKLGLSSNVRNGNESVWTLCWFGRCARWVYHFGSSCVNHERLSEAVLFHFLDKMLKMLFSWGGERTNLRIIAPTLRVGAELCLLTSALWLSSASESSLPSTESMTINPRMARGVACGDLIYDMSPHQLGKNDD